MIELEPIFNSTYQEISLKVNQPPTLEELNHYRDSIAKGYQIRWAERMIGKIMAGEKFPTSYPFPLQVWKLGEQSIFSLGGELVSGYSLALKRIFGHDIFVLGYCNDVVSYIPSAQILHEGGYEGCFAQQVYGLAGTWTFDIEFRIIETLIKLAEEVGVPVPGNTLFRKNE